MQGIELSRRFYEEIVRPWLGRVAPGLMHAAALSGYGSELLGFDDETSRDHNWGPRVHVYLGVDDFQAHAQRLLKDFAGVVPEEFLGEPIGWRGRPNPPSNGAEAMGDLAHGLEFHTIESALEDQLGLRSLDELTISDWLSFPEQKLLAFTAGAVFHDDGGRLTAARGRLAYYPNDVWFYRIACQWARIGEEQAFVGRTGQVGDELGSRVIATRLIRDVMALGFLLERRYAPYAKWFGSGFSRLPIAAVLTPHFETALRADNWQARATSIAEAYRAAGAWQAERGIAPFAPIVGPYFERPFPTINVDDAVSSAQAAIIDPVIKALPLLGAIDQISDLTPLLVNSGLSRKLVRTIYDSD
jgi:predicted enzyme related to lactoylglutathione lyase